MMHELLAGQRTRLDTLAQEWEAIETRALAGLDVILDTVRAHSGTGQTVRLVHFLAGLYNGDDYPVDLSGLRGLDTTLANAFLDYLNYDRLGICNVEQHLPDGGLELQGWLRDYNIVPIERD